jgi:microcystin-dependent protein
MEGIVGMIKMVLSAHETAEWHVCDGRMLAAQDFPALYALIGNRFGGDGPSAFALPTVPQQDNAFFVIKVRPAAVDAVFQGMVAQMVLWPGASVPANWLPCDGRLIQGKDYPLLQKVAAASGNGTPMPEFHLPKMDATPGLQYIICVVGQDPMATVGNGATAHDDDDY